MKKKREISRENRQCLLILSRDVILERFAAVAGLKRVYRFVADCFTSGSSNGRKLKKKTLVTIFFLKKILIGRLI